MNLTSLDLRLSGATIALCLMLETFALRDGAGLPQARALAALAISAGAQTIASLAVAQAFR